MPKNIIKHFLAICKILCLLCCPLTAWAQFNYEVYSGSFNTLPDFSGLTPIATGSSNTIDLSVTSEADNFALTFTNTISVSVAGNYEFSVRSDDGSKLYIDNNVVVDNDGLHAAVTVINSVFLSAGNHSFRVEFFELSGGQVLEVGFRTENMDFEAIPSDGVLVYNSDVPSEAGEWGAVIPWPEIAISAVNLPDGRVLTWSSTETNDFPSGPDFTHASIFDPVLETFTTIDSNFHDMFCAGISTLENGVIIASGGNPDDNKTSSFDPATLTWSALANMNDRRWYGSNVTLPNNEIFSTFAKTSGNRSERYNPILNTWTPTPNATMQTLLDEQNAINAAPNPTGAFTQEWWAHIAVTPQGDVFQGGPTQTWHRFDPLTGNANTSLGQPLGDNVRMYGNAVTYDAGKVLLVGGGDRRSTTPTSVNNVYLVDLNGPTPVVTAGTPMNFPRALSNTVTLPNGEVLVIGGNTGAKIFSDQGSILSAEIYTPSTDSWRIVDHLSIPRNYHSTALLLKDGRVLSAGGGACGTCSANHLDGQIFSPPYLFNNDDTPATRPTLTNVNSQIRAGDEITITASSDTVSFSMVRLSGTTHHLNTDQRFLPVTSINNGDGTHTLTFHANPNVLIVGNYWLFAVNANGTPSIGETIQVIRDTITIPPGTNNEVYISDLTWTSEQNGWGPAERDLSNGEAAANDGLPITLNGVVYTKGVGVHANSEITIALNGGYTEFLTNIGLDDERNGLSGNVRFEIDVDGVNQFVSGTFIDTTPTESVSLDVTGHNTLTLKVLANDGSISGDHADWANARLMPALQPGYRFFRYTPTKLRDDVAANSVQLAELSFHFESSRLTGATVLNPGGNNSVGELPAMADDINIATKWLDFNKGALVYDYGSKMVIDSYGLTTANDAPEKDPVRWLLEGSQDNINWFIIDDQTGQDFATPLARQTAIAPIDVVVPGAITPLPEQPRNSSTLLVEDNNGSDRVWNVNPDNNTVSVSDDQGNLLQEINVGNNPWALAKQPSANKILVTNKQDASITVIDTQLLTVDQTIALPRGSQPHGIVFEGDGSHYYVVLEATAVLEKRNSSTHALVTSLQLSGTPKHLSISFDDSRIFVSNFITPLVPGENTGIVDINNGLAEIFSVSPTTMTLANTINLTHDGRAISESQGPGMPNYLGAAVVSFDDQYAYIPSKKDNINSGILRGNPGMTFESTVRANTSRFDLATETEDSGFRVDHDNASISTHAALSGDNRYVFVTLETSRELAVYDTENGFELLRLPTGRAPQSVALSNDGKTAYVHNFMDRSISRFDLTEMLQTNLPASNVLASINVVTNEQLSPPILLGKQHFYDAADDRISRDNYMSCAACHKEGKHDGRVWDFTGMGEGLRRTISLRGKGSGHGMLHWSSNFDEVQDFEHQIRNLNLGTGLMSQTDFDNTNTTLGNPKTGLSSDLDALADYVNSLTDVPISPYRASPAAMSTNAQTGKSLFVNKNCIACHTIPTLTDSPLALLHNIGTLDTDSGNRLGGALTGFDTPGLLGSWIDQPYLHDGSAATLSDAISAHTNLPASTPTELNALVSFLQESEPADIVDMIDTDNDGVFDFEDPAIANACIPSAFVAVCAQDTDGDGESDFSEGATADSDNDGLFNYEESSILDADSDGINDEADPANNDACTPNVFVSACTQDTDGDGVSDFNEGEFVDTDIDGLFDYEESSLIDSDSDGTNNQVDPANNDACIPNAFVSVCAQDTDGDGITDFNEGELTDTDADGLFDYQESSLVDTDSDGTNDQVDPANNDACIPNAFVSACAQDTDGDGTTDFNEGELTDTDADGLFDYQESSLTDTDLDGTNDQADPANSDACTPNVFVSACSQDTDGDGITDFNEGELTDTDADGLFDYQESSLTDTDLDGTNDQVDPANNDTCIPNAFISICAQDTDGDGITDFNEGELTDTDADGLFDYQESLLVDTDSDGTNDQADPANNDACAPNVFVSACAQDTDGDGTTDFNEGELTDTDADGLFDYQESSILDADSDGTNDQADSANNDACIPNVFVSVCAQDTDGDGITDFNEGELTDTDSDGLFDYQESSILDADSDGTNDQADAANNDACIPNVFVSACAQDTDGDGTTDFNEGELTDTDSDGLFDYQESSLIDTDSDGTNDQIDAANNDACIPNVFISVCTQDTDGDGVSDFNEGELTDTDADGLFDYQESALTDADSDGTNDQADIANNDACIPNVFVAACTQDTDSDGVSDFNEGEFIDTDTDGLFDYQESSLTDTDSDGTNDQADIANNDACIPNVFVAACTQDTDSDGVSDFNEGEFIDTDSDGLLDYQESSLVDTDSDGTNDQADVANNDACMPNVFVSACSQDTDSDGVSDFNEGEFIDTDSDGLFDYQESSLTDTDSDGTNDQADAANNDTCIPNAFISICARDTDGDGTTDFNEGELTDTDADGLFDYQESSLVDTDSDGTNDQTDPANNDACAPNVFVSACSQDSDGDGVTDFNEGELTDTDSDGLLDYQESSLTDTDLDGTNDQSDSANNDACIPNVFVSACAQDTDGDGATDFNEGELTDTDADGLFDYQESSILDTDSDGTNDQADAANNDACIPNVFVSVCAQDTDGDGITDFNEGELTDTDSDGLFDFEESSILDSDSDGVFDQNDANNSDACIPSSFVSVCTQDTDSDGVTDFNEGETTDSDFDGIFNYLESSILDADSDGSNDQADPANNDPCVPTAFVSVCTHDSDGDGLSDFIEGELTDTDGDGLFDYEESLLIDDDNDTVVNQLDAENTDSCVPDVSYCTETVPAAQPIHHVLLALALFIMGIYYRRNSKQRSAS